MTKIEICLTCPLLFCDEDHIDCPWRIAQDRKPYWKQYYQDHREQKIAAAKIRQKEKPNKKKRTDYWRNYKRRKKHEKEATIKAN